MKVGDVIRYNFHDELKNRDSEPTWVVVTDLTGPHAYVLVPGTAIPDALEVTRLQIGGPHYDPDPYRDYPPPEEWPDEVHRALALYAMTGDAT